jgi:hypothetical protein
MPFEKGNQLGKIGGKHEKTKQWESLGEAIRTTHCDRFNLILAGLEDDKFIDRYLQVLEYFKPKLARTEVKNEGEMTINLNPVSFVKSE